MGEVLRARVDRLNGVDLAPAMIARARGRGVYDALGSAEATEYLTRSAPRAFDCIVAADALPYFGDLAPVFAGCRRALIGAGLIAFSIETFDGDGFRLGPTMRFVHARAYVEETAAASRLKPLLVRPDWVRREGKVEAPGLVCVFEARDR